MDTRLEGKNILITGASSGIGREVAIYLDSLGCHTIMTARREHILNNLKSNMKNESYIFPLDLGNDDKIRQLFNFCLEKDLKLDGFVHCAGINILSPIQTIDIEEAKEIMNVNFFSFMQLCKFFCLKKYSKEGSSIVAMSGFASLGGQKGNGQYAVSKAAINSAVKTMSQEFLRRRIRVNAILPNYVDTDMMERAKMEGGITDNDSVTHPLGIIPAIEIAYLTEYLLSDCSKSVTGTLIPISSGCGFFY